MKYLKMLGLTVMTAAALTALAGAGTASAYTLCAQSESTTGSGQIDCVTGSPTHYPKGSTFKSTTSQWVQRYTGSPAFGKLRCHSLLVEELTSTGSDDDNNVSSVTRSLKNTGCESEEPNLGTCTVTEGTGYTESIAGTTNGNGTLTITSTTSTKVTCGGFFSCTYTTAKNGITLSIVGGNPATLVASEVPLTLASGGIGCGTGATWSATYTLIEPQRLWIGTGDV